MGSSAQIPKVVGNSVRTTNGQPLRLLGVDVPGTQKACVAGRGISVGPLDANEAKAIAAWHTNVVRIPLNEDCWLGINGVPKQYPSTAYQRAINAWVTDLNNAGLVVILTLFSAAPGTIHATGQWPMADADHAGTFWHEVASSYSSRPSVIFDLFNEPYIGGSHPNSADWACWLHGCQLLFPLCPINPQTGEFARDKGCPIVRYQTEGMQQLVDIVRNAGAEQPIMVGGLNWAGDPCGVRDSDFASGQCQWLANEPTDPEHQLIVSFHTYPWTACASVSCWNADVAPVTTHVPVVTGEFGQANCGTNFLNSFMRWADRHNVSYLAQSWATSSETNSTACHSVSMLSHEGVGLKLLSTWDGTPNIVAASGSVFRAHLASLGVGER
jgi:hypothetical protein